MSYRNIKKLVSKIESAGVTLILENGELITKADEGVLTEKRLEILRKHKTEIIDTKFPLDAMETAFIEKWKAIFSDKRVDFLDLRPLAEDAGYLSAPRPPASSSTMVHCGQACPSSLQRIQATFDKLVASGRARRVGDCGIVLCDDLGGI